MSKGKWIILGCVVLALLAYLVGIPYISLKAADKAYDEGAYEEAYDRYLALQSNTFFEDQGIAGARRCQLGMAEEACSNGDYDKAISIYNILGKRNKVQEVKEIAADKAYETGDFKYAAEQYDNLKITAKAEKAWNAYGELCLSEQRFEEAVSVFEKLNNAGQVLQVRQTWANALLEQKQYREAAEQYRLSGMAEQASEAISLCADELLAAGKFADVPLLLKDYPSEKSAQYVFDAVTASAQYTPDSAPEALAGEYGRHITDVNTQLTYCSLLKNAGMQMDQVYPEGVQVNVDLSRFQLYEILANGSVNPDAMPDCSKILIFSRVENKPSLTSIYGLSQAAIEADDAAKTEARKTTPSLYTVYLQPAMMDRLFTFMQAGSIDECTSIILLEKGYYPSGGLTIQTTQSTSYSRYSVGSYNTTSYRLYTSYDAYEGIVIYDMKDPSVFAYYDMYYTEPLVANSVVGNSYRDLNLDLSTEQINEILQVLEDKTSPAYEAVTRKYSQDVIDFVAHTGLGNYVYIPETDAQGNQIGRTYSADDGTQWNTEKYMLGVHDEGWLDQLLNDGAIENMALYMVLNQP